MPELELRLVDVFAVGPYTGNQLAVFLETGDLDAAAMQQLAREMNYSETTFVRAREPREGGYDVRIFTPSAELPFAGHPTLGTAAVLAGEYGIEGTIRLNLGVGQIPVTTERDATGNALHWMRQPSPEMLRFLDSDAIATTIRLPGEAIDTAFPVEEVSTGVPFAIAPVKSLALLKQARLDADKFAELREATAIAGVLMFCRETHHPENDLCVRVFAPGAGVPEDPATGSANGCLAAYLVAHRVAGSADIDLRVEQGYELQRPSLLHLRGRAKGDAIEVEVGGRVIPVARARLV